MAQGEGFKHITVTPPEDDDEVVYAGAAALPDADAVAEAGLEEALPDADVLEEGAWEEAVVSGESALEEAALEEAVPAETAPAEAAVPAKPAPSGVGASAGDSYRDPTLEDLEGAPMPLAQKIVIAVAVLCIIGAAVYYLLFMG